MHGSSLKLILVAFVLIIAAVLYWKFHSSHHIADEAYVAEPIVNVWSTTAQVRQLAAEIHWGEKVEVLGHSDTFTKVRTVKGVSGWVDGRRLVDGTTWLKEQDLVTKARPMPQQASGRTKVTTNLRLEPGRNSQRIYQLPGSVHVTVLARATADASPPPRKVRLAPQKKNPPPTRLLQINPPQIKPPRIKPPRTNPIRPNARTGSSSPSHRLPLQAVPALAARILRKHRKLCS